MRINSLVRHTLIAASLVVVAAPAGAFDGSADELERLSPAEAFREGARAYYSGDKELAFSALREAARQGHAMAQWKLARMYAEGDGVARDDREAFRYYSALADAHADDPPSSPAARFVSNAFVELGAYFMDGIPQTNIEPDNRRAVDLYTYAATYFADPEAQFRLAKMYLDGEGVREDRVQAARWLRLAARKNHSGAQARLGEMLFRGEGVPRRAAEGLMWLEMARKQAVPEDEWIFYLHEHAFAEAAAEERARAMEMVESAALPN